MGRHITEDGLGRRQTRQLHEHLQKTLRKAGPGSIRRLEQRLGVRDGWLRYQRFRGTLDVPSLLQILHFLDLDAAPFFAEALGGTPVTWRPEPVRGTAPLLVRKAQRRFSAPPADDTASLPDSELPRLDRLRRDDPNQALRQISRILARSSRPQLARLLAIAGSAWRHLFQLTKARHALDGALKMAEELDQPSRVADVLQRLGYVLADGGQYAAAWRLARRATELYTQVADLEGIGRSFVDQGTWLFYLHRIDEAMVAQQTALRYLPDTAGENRSAALHCLSLSCRQQGDAAQAANYAKQARALADDLDASGKARLIWLQGSIAADLDRLDEAEAYLDEATRLFMELHPADAALVTTERVHLQLRRGHTERAYQIAQSMIQLVEPLRRQPLISAALVELLRCSIGGHGLTLPLVIDVEAKLRKERERSLRSRNSHF